MTEQLANAAYLGSIILFILALGGLSNQETARRGNFYGMLGMAIAL
ncbi:MAG: NAD(P)(+) transhydrogenase (Re/Si-specific) subunit beta, partial [Verrucomicrobiota bacterium]|nr:NAD(P)(+) transhydrogenase (Re/Si-specific) subunit beta [Verrucomicrobiota bacterium]